MQKLKLERIIREVEDLTKNKRYTISKRRDENDVYVIHAKRGRPHARSKA